MGAESLVERRIVGQRDYSVAHSLWLVVIAGAVLIQGFGCSIYNTSYQTAKYRGSAEGRMLPAEAEPAGQLVYIWSRHVEEFRQHVNEHPDYDYVYLHSSIAILRLTLLYVREDQEAQFWSDTWGIGWNSRTGPISPEMLGVLPSFSRKRVIASRDSAKGRTESSSPAAIDDRIAGSVEGSLATDSLLTRAFGNYHALVIGNNQYETLPILETAISDARLVADVLRSAYGFDVTLLENATRADVVRALDEVRRSRTEEDNLVIYYAGHGWLDEDSDRGFWLPIDASEGSRVNWISNTTITDALKATKAKRILVIADSCYSGALARSIQRGLRASSSPAHYLAELSHLRSRTVLSSGALEPVTDSGYGGHSVFSNALVGALRRNSGVLDGTQLFFAVRDQVRLNAQQTPQYQNIREAGHELGGDFVFIKSE